MVIISKKDSIAIYLLLIIMNLIALLLLITDGSKLIVFTLPTSLIIASFMYEGDKDGKDKKNSK